MTFTIKLSIMSVLLIITSTTFCSQKKITVIYIDDPCEGKCNTPEDTSSSSPSDSQFSDDDDDSIPDYTNDFMTAFKDENTTKIMELSEKKFKNISWACTQSNLCPLFTLINHYFKTQQKCSSDLSETNLSFYNKLTQQYTFNLIDLIFKEHAKVLKEQVLDSTTMISFPYKEWIYCVWLQNHWLSLLKRDITLYNSAWTHVIEPAENDWPSIKKSLNTFKPLYISNAPQNIINNIDKHELQLNPTLFKELKQQYQPYSSLPPLSPRSPLTGSTSISPRSPLTGSTPTTNKSLSSLPKNNTVTKTPQNLIPQQKPQDSPQSELRKSLTNSNQELDTIFNN